MKDSDWQILYELSVTPNITKVARRLYITQPSLTKRLKSIEDEFQIKIVNRTTKGVEFTKEGELLAGKAKEYINFMSRVRKELRELCDEEKVVITIGSSYTYSKYVLSDILFEYTKEHPNIRFEVQNEQSNLLFRKACDGEVDVAFVRGDYEGPVKMGRIDEYRAYILTNEPIILEKLPNMTKIDYKISDCSQRLLEEWWNSYYNISAPVGMNAGYVDVAWQLVGKGLGYTCCFLPDDYENRYNLVLTPMDFPDGRPVVRNTWFVYKEQRNMSWELRKFIKYVEDNIVIEA